MQMQTKSFVLWRDSIYYQLVSVNIPLDKFKTIANSKAFEIKIGEIEFSSPIIDSKRLQAVLPFFRKMIVPIEKAN